MGGGSEGGRGCVVQPLSLNVLYGPQPRELVARAFSE